jgi:beta-lactamase regulating signal transducer with metallopeptidase domain
MNIVQSILSGAAAEATGWALVHVLWQATLIAGLLGLVLIALRHRSPNSRYVAACIALGLTLALPIATGINSFELMPDSGAAVLTDSAEGSVVPLPDSSATRMGDVAFPPLSLSERISRLPVEPALPWVVGIWLAGVTLLSTRIAFGLTSVTRMGQLGTSPVPAPVERAMNELVEVMGLARGVKILRSRRIEVPTVIGWLEPVILVPASAIGGLSPQQLRTILAHELAHIRRHDFAVNLVQTAVETLLFFHPAVWWISRQVRIEREHCCDDEAVALCGDPVDYARALATMEELRLGPVPAVAANGGSLSGRIRRLLGIRDDENSEGVRPAIALAAALMVTMIAVLPLFAGSYIYEAVTARAPGEHIVVIGDSDEDLDDIVDKVIDAHLQAAGVLDRTRQIREGEHARSERMRIEIEHARDLAHDLKEEHLAAIARARAEVERARAIDVDELVAVAAEARLEAELLADLWAGYSFSFTPPAAPAPPSAPTLPAPPAPRAELVAPAVPAAPAPPVPPAGPFLSSFSGHADLPMIRDIAVTHGAFSNDEPLDFENPTVDELIFLARLGIDPNTIREMQAAGLEELTARELAILRSHDVRPEAVRQMRALFGDDLSAASIGAMTGLGIDAEWIRGMSAAGMKLTASDAVRMKSVGVDASYAKSIRSAGYPEVTATDLVRLKSLGVDAETIQTLNATRNIPLSIRDIVRLRSAGIDAEYLKSWK